MKERVQSQSEEVAGGRRATSAQPRHASADLMLVVFSSERPHPNPPAFAIRTNGAPHEGLLFAPLIARSRKHKKWMGKPKHRPRNSP